MSEPQPLLLAVTGSPVLHSRSPQIMNAALRAAGIDGVYTRVAAASAREATDLVRMLAIRGLNVTAPFKPDMLAPADYVDDAARFIGGANTIVNEEGCLAAYNTDDAGVVRSLRERNIPTEGTRVVVVGAGGAARGAVYGLTRAGADVCIVNRTGAKADELAERMGCRANAWDALHDEIRAAQVVLSTLSPNLQVIDPDWLAPGQVFFDANYKGSTVSAAAAAKGCIVLSGLDWLIHQAAPAFEHFTGRDCSRSMLEPGLDAPAPAGDGPVALVGFMGVGKTTAGKRLARLLDRRFVDTDALVEERTGKTIPRLFAEDGEDAFRDAESEALRHAVETPDVVVSCGGGMVLRPENREILKRRTLCIWLVACTETVLRRTRGSSRPLLRVPDPQAQCEGLFAARRCLYADAAHLVVSTDHRTSAQAAEKVHEEMRATFPH